MNITEYSAILFDLDGVLTPTGDLHQQAWGDMFTAYFAQHNATPYTDQDYYTYLDGRRRDEAISSILASRGLPADDTTINELGLRKNADFLRLLAAGIDPYPGSLALLNTLHGTTRLAVVSSSKNAPQVLQAAGLSNYFELVVDGNTATEHGLTGKPAPDTYLYAAKTLGLTPADCVVIEDATSGVAAGRAGNFGLIIGVDRGTGEQALRDHGADTVVGDLADLC